MEPGIRKLVFVRTNQRYHIVCDNIELDPYTFRHNIIRGTIVVPTLEKITEAGYTCDEEVTSAEEKNALGNSLNPAFAIKLRRAGFRPLEPGVTGTPIPYVKNDTDKGYLFGLTEKQIADLIVLNIAHRVLD